MEIKACRIFPFLSIFIISPSFGFTIFDLLQFHYDTIALVTPVQFTNYYFSYGSRSGDSQNILYYNPQNAEEQTISQIANLVKFNKFKSAALELAFVQDRAKAIRKIVQQVKIYEKEQNTITGSAVDKVVGFLIAQHDGSRTSCGAIQDTMSNLLKEIQKNNDSIIGHHHEIYEEYYIPPEVLTLAYLFNADCAPSFDFDPETFSNLADMLIGKWAKMISLNDNSVFVEVSKFCRKMENHRPFRKYVGKIISVAYNFGNDTNFDAVSYLIQNSECDVISKVLGCSTLFSELKTLGKQHSEESLKLAYLLKNVGERINVNRVRFSIDRKLQSLYDSLKSSIPEKIRSLIWGTKCTIKNYGSGKYLRPSKNGTSMVFMERNVGSGMSGGGDVGYNDGWWLLETFLEQPGKDALFPNQNLRFAIKIVQIQKNKPFLCVNMTKSPRFGEGSGGVLETCYKTGVKKNALVLWTLKPVNGTRDGNMTEAFRIYAEDHKRRYYLYKTHVQGIDNNKLADYHGHHMLPENQTDKWDESLWEFQCK